MKTFLNLTKDDIILSLRNSLNINIRDFSKYIVKDILKRDDNITDFECDIVIDREIPTTGKLVVNIPNNQLRRTNFNNTFYVLDETKGNLVCNNWSEVGKGSILYSTILNLKEGTLEEFVEHKVLGISKTSRNVLSILTSRGSREELLKISLLNDQSKCRFYNDFNICRIVGFTKEFIISTIRTGLENKINDQLQQMETLEESTTRLMYLKDSL